MQTTQSLDINTIRLELGIEDQSPIRINSQIVDKIVGLRMNDWIVLCGKNCDLEVNTALVDWKKKMLLMQFTKFNPAKVFIDTLLCRINYMQRNETHIELFKVIVSSNDDAVPLDIESSMWLGESKIKEGVCGLKDKSRREINEGTGLDLTAIDIAKYHSILSNLTAENIEYLIDIATNCYKVRDIARVNVVGSKSNDMALMKFKIWGLIANVYTENGRYWLATEEAIIVQKLYNLVK